MPLPGWLETDIVALELSENVASLRPSDDTTEVPRQHGSRRVEHCNIGSYRQMDATML